MEIRALSLKEKLALCRLFPNYKFSSTNREVSNRQVNNREASKSVPDLLQMRVDTLKQELHRVEALKSAEALKSGALQSGALQSAEPSHDPNACFDSLFAWADRSSHQSSLQSSHQAVSSQEISSKSVSPAADLTPDNACFDRCFPGPLQFLSVK